MVLVCCAGQAKKSTKVDRTAVRPDAEVQAEQELRYYFYEAMHCIDQARYDDATALLLHCQMINPNDAAVCHYLGIVYGGLRMRALSEQYKEKAYRLCPKEYWYEYILMCYDSRGGERVNEGRRELQKLVKQYPDDEEILELYKQVCRSEGNWKEVLKILDKIDRIDGKSAYTAKERYEAYRRMGKTKQAYGAIDDFLRYEPDNYYIQSLKGDILLNDGREEEGLAYFDETLQANPSNPYIYLSLSDYFGKKGDLPKASGYMKSILENEMIELSYKQNVIRSCDWLTKDDTAHLEALETLQALYPLEESAVTALAAYHAQHANYAEAKRLYWTALDINADNRTTWKQLLGVFEADTAVDRAEQSAFVRRALQQMPNEKQWYQLMAADMAANGQSDSVIYYGKQGLAVPDTEDDIRYKLIIYILLGDEYMKMEQADSAYLYYDAALRIDPENVYVLNNYAYYLAINGGDLRKAEKMSQQTIKKEPNNPTFLDTYAWILHLQGQTMLSRFYMQQAWDKAENHDDPDIVEHYQTIIGK